MICRGYASSDILQFITSGMMSSDDPGKSNLDGNGGKKSTYFLKQHMPWSAAELWIFLHGLDDVHVELRQRNLLGTVSGAPLQERRPGVAASKQKPPIGAPRAFYDPLWLSQLSKVELDRLTIINAVFNYPDMVKVRIRIPEIAVDLT